MKKVALIVSVIVVVLFVALPFKWAIAVILGSFLMAALFAVVYIIASKADEKLAEIEKEDPKLAQEIRFQMWEQAMRDSRMFSMGC